MRDHRSLTAARNTDRTLTNRVLIVPAASGRPAPRSPRVIDFTHPRRGSAGSCAAPCSLNAAPERPATSPCACRRSRPGARPPLEVPLEGHPAGARVNPPATVQRFELLPEPPLRVDLTLECRLVPLPRLGVALPRPPGVAAPSHTPLAISVGPSLVRLQTPSGWVAIQSVGSTVPGAGSGASPGPRTRRTRLPRPSASSRVTGLEGWSGGAAVAEMSRRSRHGSRAGPAWRAAPYRSSPSRTDNPSACLCSVRSRTHPVRRAGMPPLRRPHRTRGARPQQLGLRAYPRPTPRQQRSDPPGARQGCRRDRLPQPSAAAAHLFDTPDRGLGPLPTTCALRVEEGATCGTRGAAPGPPSSVVASSIDAPTSRHGSLRSSPPKGLRLVRLHESRWPGGGRRCVCRPRGHPEGPDYPPDLPQPAQRHGRSLHTATAAVAGPCRGQRLPRSVSSALRWVRPDDMDQAERSPFDARRFALPAAPRCCTSRRWPGHRLVNDGRVPAAMLARFTTSQDPAADAADWWPLASGSRSRTAGRSTGPTSAPPRTWRPTVRRTRRSSSLPRPGEAPRRPATTAPVHPKHCPALPHVPGYGPGD